MNDPNEPKAPPPPPSSSPPSPPTEADARTGAPPPPADPVAPSASQAPASPTSSAPPPPASTTPPREASSTPPPPAAETGGGDAGAGGTPPPSGTAPPPPTGGAGGPGGSGYVSPNRPLMIVLSYLGILAVIPLLAEKEDREVQWHAKHGLVLAVFWFLVYVVLWILGSVLAFVDLGCTGCVLSTVTLIAFVVIHAMAIYKGLNGERLRLPVISDFADRF